MTRTKCPFCSEKIALGAKKCRYCGEWLNKSPKSITRFFSKKKIFLAVIALLVFLFLKEVLWDGGGSSNIQTQPSAQPTEQSLREVVEEQYRLINSKNKSDLSRLYQEFYSPEHVVKQGTEDDFINNLLVSSKKDGIDHQEFIIHSINVQGGNGYVDRTQKLCGNASCGEIKSQNRMVMVYAFFQGKWFMTSTPTFCSRSVPYSNPPEFDRAYSLIIQRTASYKTDFELIKNCVLFKYAVSDNEMIGAEGYFSFVNGQSADKLEILVSPRYKIKDDLITSVLVIHELTHAVDYVRGLASGKAVDCYTTEAGAFQNQNWFISILNPEEKASIDARLAVGGSEELRSIKYVWDSISNARGATYDDKALNYVKSSPFYQKQCASQ